MTSTFIAREAKEFLIAQIVDEAAREGQPLDDIERRMLYFTETGWMPEDTWQASEIFDRDYDETEYEHRIAQLVRTLKQRPEHDAKRWNAAWRILSKEDHYLLILIDQRVGTFSSKRPPHDVIRLILTAFAAAAVLVAATFLYHHWFD